jgi:hypothetical protein
MGKKMKETIGKQRKGVERERQEEAGNGEKEANGERGYEKDTIEGAMCNGYSDLVSCPLSICR